jgi:5-(carboxyamino)imidazole ribonucleotide mutase
MKGLGLDMKENAPLVGILMGSKSDWETMQVAAKILDEFGVVYEAKVASAHRSPELVAQFVKSAELRGMEVLIAAAGLAAHLPGVVAAMTLLPVLGVPMHSQALGGLDALLAIVQMPGGVPVGTLAIGSHGAKNSALLAIRILANSRPELREKLRAYHEKMAEQVKNDTLS